MVSIHFNRRRSTSTRFYFVKKNTQLKKAWENYFSELTSYQFLSTLLSLKLLLFSQESPDPAQSHPSSNGRAALLAPKLEMIGEDETMDSFDLYDPYGDDQSENDMDFLEVELVRSK